MVLMLFVAVSVVMMIFVWVMPTEAIQSWMVKRAGSDRFASYAASEQAAATWLLLRMMLPILSISLIAGVYFSDIVNSFLRQCGITLLEQTSIDKEAKRDSKRTILFRFLLFGWFSLGLFHFAGGIWKRIEDWPWYHLNSGPEIMPNISDSNRDVIRFLKETTEEDSRILIVSDQKLFFLSYYLLPRRLFHVIHPESEFVIPKANQQRQLTAYRFSELDPETLSRISPDYILEYFEGSRYLEEENFEEDEFWMRFQKRQYGPDYKPAYNVRLRRFVPGNAELIHHRAIPQGES